LSVCINFVINFYCLRAYLNSGRDEVETETGDNDSSPNSPNGTSFATSLIFMQPDATSSSEEKPATATENEETTTVTSSSEKEGINEEVKRVEPINISSFSGPIPAPFFTLTPSFLVSSAAARTFTYPILLDPTRGDESIDALLSTIEENNISTFSLGGGSSGGGDSLTSTAVGPILPPAIPSRSFLSPETEFRTEFYEVFITKREEKGLVRELAKRMFEVDIGQFDDTNDEDESDEDESSGAEQDEKEVVALSSFFFFFFFFFCSNSFSQFLLIYLFFFIFFFFS
jgi:hypothetical protein